MRSIDRRAAVRAVVMAAWAGFFLWLWLSEERTRFLGPRTYWVVVFGAITLSLATIAQLFILKRKTTEPSKLSARDLGGAMTMLVPILLVLAVPNAQLGALAADRKSAGGGSLTSAFAEPQAGQRTGPVSFIDIHFAEQSAEYADILSIYEGLEVELLGFVSHEGSAPPDTFELTRFYVSCCAADALPYSVSVAGGDYEDDTWLEVAGALEMRGGDFVIVPKTIETTTEPKTPYLTY